MPGARDAAIRIRKDVVFRDLEGELVLLNLATGVYFGLDPIGTRIWALIDDGHTADEIVNRITAEYEVGAEACRADLEKFFATLRDNDLVDLDAEW